MNKIIKPTFVINEKISRANIKRMADKVQGSKVGFRPHFKTHQSAEIGEWFREQGVDKITVSSVGMAEYFAAAGWSDILIAFPVNILEIKQINRLASKINLSLLVENREVIHFLDANLRAPVNIYLKIDTGYHRTGILPENTELISDILSAVSKSNYFAFFGFLTHSGNTYHAHSKQEILDIYKRSVMQLQSLRSRFASAFPQAILSIGDTPSCSLVKKFNGVDEIRPGNFVFYDAMQQALGSCSFEDLATAIFCPVVAIHEERNECVIYGGAVHLSKEFLLTSSDEKIYGHIVLPSGNSWTKPVENARLCDLSQEHGIVKCSNPFLNSIKPGDMIGILPIHSCLTANLFSKYKTNKGEEIMKFTVL